MLKKMTFDFLKGLKKNNSKEWFDKNRDDYREVYENFEGFTQDLIDSISKFDPSIASSHLLAKDCIPRLNRDLRFSKDKSPYKTYLYAVISSGGRKSGNAVYYVMLDPDKCCFGAGSFQPDPDKLKKLRQEIDYNFEEWIKIAENSTLKTAFPDGIIAQESLQKVPNGFDASSPAAAFLKMKSFFVRQYYADSFFLKEDNFDGIIKRLKTCVELNKFVNRV
ncbi:TIGR02453 family protein [Pedobacter antarcticus]|nr:TIGR02453 family protein [Pedobacter antarcticus]